MRRSRWQAARCSLRVIDACPGRGPRRGRRVTFNSPEAMAAVSSAEVIGSGRLVLTYPTASERASCAPLVPVQRPSRYSPMIRPSCRTCAYPYSSERERHRSQARSSSVVSFSQGAEGQITESWVMVGFVWYGIILQHRRGHPCPPCASCPIVTRRWGCHRYLSPCQHHCQRR